MNIKEKAAEAAELKRQGKCNCCQAVVRLLADETDIPVEQLDQLAAGFALGMGNMENTCGALIGAGIIAGLKTKGVASVRYTKPLSELFRDKCGSMICKELKGRDTGKVLCSCPDCVKNAVLCYGEIFGIE